MTTVDKLSAEAEDVAGTLEAIRAAVRQRSGYASQAEVPIGGVTSPVAEAVDLARVSAHLPVTWDTPVIGRFVALSKRAMRLMLRWYINPIIEQQNAFNDSVVRALTALEARQQVLEARIGRVEQQQERASE